jgi:hypothetical protein
LGTDEIYNLLMLLMRSVHPSGNDDLQLTS